ncbi:tandem-95 repeat protein, partial [Candidatus Woesearchaeota archaeon]|nr:tandem-95 repeat protein [Candidatus Woesearchaeota archaeon]
VVVRATDGNKYSEQNFTIIVTNVNDAPIGLEIPEQVWNEDENHTIDLSDYFVDVDGDSMTFSYSGGTNIAVQINGSIAKFIPAENWQGQDTISFYASDGLLTSDANDALLTVSAVNDKPVLNVPSQSTSEDTPITVNLDLYSSDTEGSALSYAVILKDTAKANCTVAGSILTIEPALDYNGIAHCTVVANDGTDDSNPSAFEIIISAVNDAPIGLEIPTQSWDEDKTHYINLMNYFSDVEGDTLAFTYLSPAHVTVVFSGPAQLALIPELNWLGTSSMSITANDGNGGTTTSNLFDLVVNSVNDAPVLELIADVSIVEGQAMKIVPSATDIDGDSLSYSFSAPLNSSGEWQTDFNDAGVYTATVTVSDGQLTDSQEVTITVGEAGNHAPVLQPIADATVNEGDLVDINPTATDIDEDVLTYTYSSPLNSNGEWQTGFTDAGVYPITVTVSDGMLGDSKSFTLTVLESGNHAPVLEHINDVEVVEGNLVDVNPVAYDPDGDQITITFSAPLDNNGEWQTGFTDAGTYMTTITVSDGQLNTSQNVQITIVESANHNPELNFIPDMTVTEGDLVKIVPSATDVDGDTVTFSFSAPLDNNGEWQTGFTDAGTYMTTVYAMDGKGGIEAQNVIITVNDAGNHAPVLDQLADVSVTEGEQVVITPHAVDVDGDTLSYTYTAPIDSDGEWQTGFTDAGVYPITVTVSDGEFSDSENFTLTVLESGNHAPSLDVPAEMSVIAGELVKIKPSATDPDGDAVMISISKPVGDDGVWQTKEGDEGSYFVIVTASDGHLTTTKQIVLTVLEKPFEKIGLDKITVEPEYLEAGEELKAVVKITNNGNVDMKGVSIKAIVSEFGLLGKTRSFKVKAGQSTTQTVSIEIPAWVEPGTYDLRVTVEKDNVRRVKHRMFTVI